MEKNLCGNRIDHCVEVDAANQLVEQGGLNSQKH